MIYSKILNLTNLIKQKKTMSVRTEEHIIIKATFIRL